MSTVIEVKLLELKVDHNGFSKGNLKKASNLLEAILHYPNSQNPRALALKSMNLWSGKEYLAEAVHYYQEKLDKMEPPLGAEEKQRLIQHFRDKIAIDSTLFKIVIEGKPRLEINISIADENAKLEDVIKRTFKEAIKIASESIPVIGSVLSKLLPHTLDSLFSSSAEKKLKSIGKVYIDFDESMALPAQMRKEFVIQENLEVTRIRSWAWTEKGAEIVEKEAGCRLNQGQLNGYVKLDVKKI